MKVVLASSNKGKLTEFQALLTDFNYQLIAQDELNISPCPEPAVTFVENAILKARHASLIANLPALSDDSGLIVPVLQGEPGVRSARYAGEEANMAQNIQKLLTKLQDLTGVQRAAYFYCVLVFVRHANDPTPIIAEGYWHGEILTSPQGEGGFGYDPVFFVKEKKCSAAQLSRDEKNKISHRGMACQVLSKKLSAINQ